jgi:predicted transcriptional regulator
MTEQFEYDLSHSYNRIIFCKEQFYELREELQNYEREEENLKKRQRELSQDYNLEQSTKNIYNSGIKKILQYVYNDKKDIETEVRNRVEKIKNGVRDLYF